MGECEKGGRKVEERSSRGTEGEEEWWLKGSKKRWREGEREGLGEDE